MERLLDSRISFAVDPWIGIQFSIDQATKIFELMDDHLLLSDDLPSAGSMNKKPLLLNWSDGKDDQNIVLHYDNSNDHKIEDAFGVKSKGGELVCYVPEPYSIGKTVAGAKSVVNSCHTHPCRITQILAKMVIGKTFIFCQNHTKFCKLILKCFNKMRFSIVHQGVFT